MDVSSERDGRKPKSPTPTPPNLEKSKKPIDPPKRNAAGYGTTRRAGARKTM